MPIGWDHPDTARYYEAFCERHSRYHDANTALIYAALLRPGMRVLDLASGTGRTAQAALSLTGDITCMEPARAMRETGCSRLPQLRWLSGWPDEDERFDRIVCGAAIWQLTPLAETFARVARVLAAGGAFVFNIPSLYVGEPDGPGGGRDPHLYELAAKLAGGKIPAAEAIDPLPSAEAIDECLRLTGLDPQRWCARFRLTQAGLRDWMKIPPLTNALLDGLSADQRAARLDAAFAQCDAASWRWEAWTGWTAWKR